jgi:hypothetical protein
MTTSFNFDERLMHTLEGLRVHYGCATRADVLRKAVALLKIASESDNDIVFLIKSNGKKEAIKIS